MRVLGYSKKWSKLQKEFHTTFRFARKDKDWFIGEYVQEVFHPRSKDREIINPKALIVEKTNFWCWEITIDEAIEDGFTDETEMTFWLREAHGNRVDNEQIHKLKIKVLKPLVDLE